ncbi:MAG TPA: hypothetical protein VMN76_06755 [Acidobacteriota bacterium]|nr:hypothetical protein [Acidobacteriota bacterium]
MIETLIVTGLIAVGYALLFIRMSILERRINRIARLESKDFIEEARRRQAAAG